MEERPPGRPPGYTHSEETKKKITDTVSALPLPSEKTKRKMRNAHQGNVQSESTRKKIALSLRGSHQTADHRKKIAEKRQEQEFDSRVMYIDNLCLDRLAELKAIYPDQAEFFEENEVSLLIALRDVKSDKEIDDIKRYIETEDLDRYVGTLSYQYSSFPSHEDVLIDLLDEYHRQTKNKKYH